MEDPVVVVDGHSYDRTFITEWLVKNHTSPMTGERMEHKGLTSNHNLKNNIQTWLDMHHGEARAEKRRKTRAAEIGKFLEGLGGLVAADKIAEVCMVCAWRTM